MYALKVGLLQNQKTLTKKDAVAKDVLLNVIGCSFANANHNI